MPEKPRKPISQDLNEEGSGIIHMDDPKTPPKTGTDPTWQKKIQPK